MYASPDTMHASKKAEAAASRVIGGPRRPTHRMTSALGQLDEMRSQPVLPARGRGQRRRTAGADN